MAVPNKLSSFMLKVPAVTAPKTAQNQLSAAATAGKGLSPSGTVSQHKYLNRPSQLSSLLISRMNNNLLQHIFAFAALFPEVTFYGIVCPRFQSAVACTRRVVIGSCLGPRDAYAAEFDIIRRFCCSDYLLELSLEKAPLKDFTAAMFLIIGCPSLRTLSIANPGITIDWHTPVVGPTPAHAPRELRLPSLERLRVEGCVVNGLAFAVAGAPRLEALEIRRCPHFNDADLEQIESILAGDSEKINEANSVRPASRIAALIVSQCAEVSDPGVIALCRHLPFLTRLDCSGCPLVGSQILSRFVSEEVRAPRSINLKGCRALTDGAAAACIFPNCGKIAPTLSTPSLKSTSQAGLHSQPKLLLMELSIGAAGVASIGDAGLMALCPLLGHTLAALEV